jgi:hypothetical protein
VDRSNGASRGGSYDWFWLVSPKGEELDPVGPNETNVSDFRRLFEK